MINEWLKFRDIFLQETLRHDGLGDFSGTTDCVDCGKEAGIYKCLDCAKGGLLKCSNCIVKEHRVLPLHRVEVSPTPPKANVEN
jgi:hypothetical protein